MNLSPSGGNNAFALYLSKPVEASSLDLSNATLLDCINKKIEIRSRASPRFGKSMFSLIKTIKNIEEEYNCVLYPLHINEEFWSLFVQYLQDTKNYSNSSVRTIISQLKAVVEWSSHYGARIHATYNECVLPPDSVRNIALTPDDVSRIYHFNFTSIKRHKQFRATLVKVKDMFCLMCNTGLRYSDACRLRKEHFKDGVITILQQKTKRYATIDIDKLCIHKDMVNAILKKYNYSAPCSLDLSDFDKYLHTIADLCSFTEDIQKETVIGGVVVAINKKKKDLITSHTARRTFVVNNAIRGIPALAIMRATGHKTFAAFQKYLCY